SVVLTASEALSSVAGVKLDGSAVTPAVSGAVVTVSTGALVSGPHVLEGSLVDQVGKHGLFRVAFTIPTNSSDEPYVEKNTSPDVSTPLTDTGGDVTVPLPARAYAPQPAGSNGNDWLVLRLDPLASPGSLGLGLQAGGATIEVTATWAAAGTSVSS